MNELSLRGSVPCFTTGTQIRHTEAAGRTRGWWPHLRERLVLKRPCDEELDDRLLADIGLNRADLAAFRL